MGAKSIKTAGFLQNGCRLAVCGAARAQAADFAETRAGGKAPARGETVRAVFCNCTAKALMLFLVTALLCLISPAGASDAPGDCYIGLYIEPIEEQTALAHCEKQFNDGDARSGFWLGTYYHYRDIERARDYYEKAADMGDVFALHTLGVNYTFGTLLAGNNVDFEKGIELIKEAADRGFGESQGLYAHIYDRVRQWVDRDIAAAGKYYKLAAGSGDEGSMLKLAGLYLYGDYWGERENCQKNPAWKHRSDAQAEGRRALDSYAALAIECSEEKGLQYLKNAAAAGSMWTMMVLREYYRDQKPDEIQETYWLLRMAMWEHPLPGFGIIIEKTSLFQPLAPSEERLKAVAQAELKRKDSRIIEEAKLLLQDSEKDAAYICSLSDYSWYYICKGE